MFGFGSRATEGADWLGLLIGGFFLAMALAVALLTTRFFYRRYGSLAALGYVVGFWALIGVGLALVAAGKPNWQSLVAIGGCVLLNAGYGVYLEVRRKDLRIRPEERSPAPGPTMRRCPKCGLSVDAKLEKCPICGAESR